MPPPGHEPFLRAICENPADDAPRLVYADWLDEHGQPDRAEFIRLQIRLARDPDAPSVEQRCEELFRQHWPRWVVEFPDNAALWAELANPRMSVGMLLFDGDRQVRMGDTWEENVPSFGDWHRGFPSTVYIQGAMDPFLSSAHRIEKFVPVRRLVLRDLEHPDAMIRVLAGMPLLSTVRELFVRGMSPSDDAAILLAGSRFATGLRFVSMEAVRMTDRAALALANSPYLGDIETLHLTRNSFGDVARDRLRARFGFRVHC
jgi:uncharacterized protein (TIGR02996 family)